MEIKKIVIHNVKKETKNPAVIVLAEEMLNINDVNANSLVNDLYSFFSKSIKYGIFSSSEKSMFSSKFENLVQTQEIEENSFLNFSQTVLEDLKVRMDSIPQSKGGYIVFVELSNNNEDFVAVFVVRDKNGKQFQYKNNKVEIKEVVHVDTNKLAMACRINLSSYKEKKDRYLSFLSTTQDEASKYFIKWIGAEAQSKSEEDTKNFRKIINNVTLPKDENGNEISREDVRKRIYELCSKTYSNEINLRVVSEEIWKEPDYLTKYAESENISINDTFIGDKAELKKLTSYSISSDKIRLDFPTEYIGGKIRIDTKNPSIVVIESSSLASKLKEELK